jgi:hypothetical protein
VSPPPVPKQPGEIQRLYFELARLGARAEGREVRWQFGKPPPEEVVVLAAQAARHEPRLLWVVVELLIRRYDLLDPLKLRRAAAKARWPATVAVALEFARKAAPSPELNDVADFVSKRLLPAAGEQFFLETHAFGGAQMRREAEESLAEYKRWGYFSREAPLAKELGQVARGTLGPSERMNLLRRLVEQRKEISLADYIAALDGRGSHRQASRDLARAHFLSRRGTTRGARYRFRAPAAPPAERGSTSPKRSSDRAAARPDKLR